jgi:hypothetical protein
MQPGKGTASAEETRQRDALGYQQRAQSLWQRRASMVKQYHGWILLDEVRGRQWRRACSSTDPDDCRAKAEAAAEAAGVSWVEVGPAGLMPVERIELALFPFGLDLSALTVFCGAEVASLRLPGREALALLDQFRGCMTALYDPDAGRLEIRRLDGTAVTVLAGG